MTTLQAPLEPIRIIFQDPNNPRYSRRIPQDEWTKHKTLLLQLHAERFTRDAMVKELAKQRNFHVQKNQLDNQMTKWGLHIYKKRGPQTSPKLSPGASRIDPFDSLCVHGLSGYAQTMLQSAIIDQWPHFALSSQKQDVEEWRSATMKLATNAPSLLHAIIYAGASYRSFFGSKDLSLEILRISSYQETTKYVREAISAPDRCSEAVILAIALLAMLVPPDFVQGRRIPNLPHALARDHEFYSHGNPDRIRHRALISLAYDRGGLASIRLVNLAGLIYMLDVIDSFSTLRKPTFPVFMPTEVYLDHLRYGQTPMNSQNSDGDCQGFSFLGRSKSSRALLEIINRTRALLDAYDTYQQDINCGIDFIKLVIARRIIQAQALSSEPGEDPLYNLCRLGLIMFLAESIEPLLTISSYHEFSAQKLLLIINECDKLGYWDEYPDVLLWATVLGGFTARASPLRWRYAEQLRGGSVPTTKEHWVDVQGVSERFLPLRNRQGLACQDFWDKACARLSDPSRRYTPS